MKLVLLPCCLFIYFYNGILNYVCVIASKTCRSRISGICQPLELLLTLKKIKRKIISAIEADAVKWPIRIILYAKISFGGQSVMWELPHRMWHDSKGPGLWVIRDEMCVLVTVLAKVLRKTKDLPLLCASCLSSTHMGLYWVFRLFLLMPWIWVFKSEHLPECLWLALLSPPCQASSWHHTGTS